MLVHVERPSPDTIHVRGRIHAPGIGASFFDSLHPGESIFGWTFEDLASRAPGTVDLSAPPQSSQTADRLGDNVQQLREGPADQRSEMGRTA